MKTKFKITLRKKNSATFIPEDNFGYFKANNNIPIKKIEILA